MAAGLIRGLAAFASNAGSRFCLRSLRVDIESISSLPREKRWRDGLEIVIFNEKSQFKPAHQVGDALSLFISEYAKESGAATSAVDGFDSLPGRRDRKKKSKRHIVSLGNAQMMNDGYVDCASVDHERDNLRNAGEAVNDIAIDGEPAGYIGAVDPVKTRLPRRCAS